MKVEQEKVAHFNPITITLETQAEANIMWSALNAPAADIMRNSHGHLNIVDSSELAYQMFCAFDDIYHLSC